MSDTEARPEEEVVQEYVQKVDQEPGLLSQLAGAPLIGSWVCLGLLAIPMLGVVLISLIIPGLSNLFQSEGETISRLESFVLLIVMSLTIPWLGFLERRAGIRLTFYWIPCVWIAVVMIIAFAAGVVVGPSMWEE